MIKQDEVFVQIPERAGGEKPVAKPARTCEFKKVRTGNALAKAAVAAFFVGEGAKLRLVFWQAPFSLRAAVESESLARQPF
jgi:hypothetical protein